MADTLIALDQVTKHYRRDTIDIPVLDKIDLEIARGEFLALMGPSGSGKTTLLNLIAGIDKPNSGRIAIDGKDITKFNEKQLEKPDESTANEDSIACNGKLLISINCFRNGVRVGFSR